MSQNYNKFYIFRLRFKDNKSQQTLPQINIEDVDISATFKLADSPANAVNIHKSASNVSVKSLKMDETPAPVRISDLVKLLTNTNEMIVSYSTKPAKELRANVEFCALLEANMQSAMKILGKHDVTGGSKRSNGEQAVQNLYQVNNEFKNYLTILNDNERLELKNDGLTVDQRELVEKFMARNENLLVLSLQLDEAIAKCPSIKLKPIAQVVPKSKSNVSIGVKSKEKSKRKKFSTFSLRKSPEKNASVAVEPKQANGSIDIRKEIAISILNVGEVLAKTIDYYTLTESNANSGSNNAVSGEANVAGSSVTVTSEKTASEPQQPEELKELIRISEQQAEYDKQLLAIIRKEQGKCFVIFLVIN